MGHRDACRSTDYRKSIHRGNIAPEWYAVRRHSFGVGLALFWLAYLAAVAYGLAWLVGFIARQLT